MVLKKTLAPAKFFCKYFLSTSGQQWSKFNLLLRKKENMQQNEQKRK